MKALYYGALFLYVVNKKHLVIKKILKLDDYV